MKRMLTMVPLAICMTFCGTLLAGPAEDAAAVRKLSGLKGGIVVCLGCRDGAFAARLRWNDQILVHALAVNSEALADFRGEIRSQGLYGPVSATAHKGKSLPYADNLVNLVVCEGPTPVPMEEILRVLAPRGKVLSRDGGNWQVTEKPWPKGMDEWTHFLHGPDNNAVARDTMVGNPRSLRWVAGPRWARSHEELASMSACVSARGRMFYIFDEAPHFSVRFAPQWKLIARDAFNGTLLWKRDVGQWVDHLRHFRAGPVHLPRRLVAAGNEVYVTLSLTEPVSAIDAVTGKTLRTYPGTEYAEEIILHDGVLYLVLGTSEAKRGGSGLARLGGEPQPSDFRRILALEASTGNPLWKKEAKDGFLVLPLTLSAKGARVFYQTAEGLVCVDARSGDRRWLAPRETPAKRMSWSSPTLVVHDDVVLLADRGLAQPPPRRRKAKGGAKPPAKPPAKPAGLPAAESEIFWGVTCFDVPGIPRKPNCILKAYDINTGEELWSHQTREGYNAGIDVFVIDGLVWTLPFSQGRDPKTGEVIRTVPTKARGVGMVHPRCYRNKATDRFIFHCRSGVEVYDVQKGWIDNNSWVRGTCQYGIMPANGLLYAPPNACGCFNSVRSQGLNALSEDRTPDIALTGKGQLTPGPASTTAATIERPAAPADWPMYRSNAERGGAAATDAGVMLKTAWQTRIGGRLTQALHVGGTVFVASVDRHCVLALDAVTGKELWQYTAGGRIDSAPAYWNGLLLFGSRDGWVHCVLAEDGQEAWRFRAAPAERLVSAFGQLESAWPVHGAVLVQNQTAYVLAGRSSYMDGGLILYGLDPRTGKTRTRNVVYNINPKTGKQTGWEGGFRMEGVRADVLTGDGRDVFLKNYRFTTDGAADPTVLQVFPSRTDTKPRPGVDKPHLFSVTGFLNEEWYVRTYWLYGTDVGGGYFRWASMAGGKQIPAGRILCFDDESFYGFGRRRHAGSWTGHRGNLYHLFAQDRVPAETLSPAAFTQNKSPQWRWTCTDPVIVRAMAVGKDHVYAASVPDRRKETGTGASGTTMAALSNSDEALAAFRGERGASLACYAKADGRKAAELALTAPPVFDGLSIANGRLLLALKDGTLVCYSRE